MADIFIFMVLGFLGLGALLGITLFSLWHVASKLTDITKEMRSANALSRQLVRSTGHEPEA